MSVALKVSEDFGVNLKKFKDLIGEKPIILCVDDESDMLEVLCDKLSHLDCTIMSASSGKQALTILKKNYWKTVLILSDFKMPHMDGFQLSEEVQKISPQIPFAILSGYIDKEMALAGMEKKIVSFLTKPMDNTEFEKVLNKDVSSRMLAVFDEQDLLKGFVDDARNLIEQIESSVLELEAHPRNAEIINGIFGMIHTIKGSSDFFEPKVLHTFTHRFEDLLKSIQNGQIIPDSGIVTVVLKALDIIKELITELANHEFADRNMDQMCLILKYQPGQSIESTSENAETGGKEAAFEHKQKKTNDVRVEMSILDDFVQAAGGMTVIRNMLNKAVSSVEKKYSGDRDIQVLSELLEELHKINAQVQVKITDIRKVPMKQVLKSLPRVIRDASKALKKQVELVAIGDDIRIDTTIAEVLNSSLVHLIRNSIDHGIETAEERKKNGKSPIGKIVIKCVQSDEKIIVTISDDGKGINTAAIKNKLVSKGDFTALEADRMPDEVLHMMIFDSGFSTAAQVTDLSGRGVGMSMVKTTVEGIGGKIQINTEANVGTTFTLDLPIPKSVFIKNNLFVCCGGQTYGFTHDQVLKVIQITPENYSEHINDLEGSITLRWGGRLYPLIFFRDILQIPLLENKKHFTLVVLQTNKKTEFAVIVDSLLDFEDAVVKSVPQVLKNINLYAGATFLGDARVGLLIDIEGLAKKCQIFDTFEADAFIEEPGQNEASLQGGTSINNEYREWLLFSLDQKGLFVYPREKIFRLEQLSVSELQESGDQWVLPFRNQILTLVNTNEIFDSQSSLKKQVDHLETIPVFVVEHNHHYVGFVVRELLDITHSESKIEELPKAVRGVKGYFILNSSTITILDPLILLEEWSRVGKDTPELVDSQLRRAA